MQHSPLKTMLSVICVLAAGTIVTPGAAHALPVGQVLGLPLLGLGCEARRALVRGGLLVHLLIRLLDLARYLVRVQPKREHRERAE